MSALPDYLATVLKKAIVTINPRTIWIFGSRARGDARDISDFDLAFLHDAPRDNWTKFYTAVKDDPPSLHRYDLVDYRQAGPELAKKIQEEGVVLYECKP